MESGKIMRFCGLAARIGGWLISAPNHKSQIASDLKSRRPNRKNFPPIAASGSSNRAICDSNLCSSRRWNRNAECLYNKSEHWAFLRRFTMSQIAGDLRFAIRITNRNRNQIAGFGALSCSFSFGFGGGGIFHFNFLDFPRISSGKSLACLLWAHTQGYCKRGSGGQREVEKIRATFWDSKLL